MSILYEKQGKIAVITINRPKEMNALDIETHQKLCDAWTDFRDAPDLWVAILTGAGDKSFSSGADLKKMLPAVAGQTPLERMGDLHYRPSFGGITKRLKINKPVIAAINGICLAGGLEMALACDLRIAVENSIFGLMEVKWGIIPGAGGTQRLPRLMPLAKAMEMILTAEPVDARQAHRIGLVHRLAPPDQVLAETEKLAGQIAAGAPVASRYVKEAINKGMDLTLEQGLRLECDLYMILQTTQDRIEGITAFREKKQPLFRGE